MFLCKKKERETSLLLIKENAESAPCLPWEDSSTDLWDCTGPPGVRTGLQITFLIHLWKSLFYKSSLRAAGTLALSSFVIQTDRTRALLQNTVKHRRIKMMILPTVCSCIHILLELAYCYSGSDKGWKPIPACTEWKPEKYPGHSTCLSPCAQRNRQTAVHRGDLYSLKSDIMTGTTCTSSCEATAPTLTEAPIHQPPKPNSVFAKWLVNIAAT